MEIRDFPQVRSSGHYSSNYHEMPLTMDLLLIKHSLALKPAQASFACIGTKTTPTRNRILTLPWHQSFGDLT